MSISISPNNRNVTLTRKSAFRHMWHEKKDKLWLLRVVTSISAFFSYTTMSMFVLKQQMKRPGWCDSVVLREDFNQAINDRKISLAETRKLAKEKKKNEKAIRVKKWKEKNKTPAPAGTAPGTAAAAPPAGPPPLPQPPPKK